MKAAHIGIVNLFDDAVTGHQCFIVVTFSAGLGDILGVGGSVIFQDANDAVGIADGAMAVDTGSDVRVTLGQLLPVHTLQMHFIFILMTTAAFFGQGQLGERGGYGMRLGGMAGGAIDKAMRGRVDLGFINIQRYLVPVSVGGKKFRITMAYQTVILIEGLNLVDIEYLEKTNGYNNQYGKEN